MLNSHKSTTSIVQFVKAAIIVISVHLNISTLSAVSHVLSTKVSPEWRVNLGFWTQKTWPFPLSRVVHSIEVTNTKITWTFWINLGFFWKLPTYPSPKPSFFLKWEVSVNISLGEG